VNTTAGGVDSGRVNGRRISPKSFHRLLKFGKGEYVGKEYRFEVVLVLGSVSLEMQEALKVLESHTNEMDTAAVRALAADRANRVNLEKLT
jgi:hypothetical protein